MKTTNIFLLFAAVAMLSACSSDVLEKTASETTPTSAEQTPIGFNAGLGNVTRATESYDALESTGHYNFGVFAYKNTAAELDASTSQYIMPNYLVGYSNGGVATDGSTEATAVGYYKDAKNTTWQRNAGTDTDNKSPWFYDYLGTEQYTNSADNGYYKASQTAYMSGNANQFLTYWDLAYKTTDFYAYAPYNTKASFSVSDKKLTVKGNADGTTSGSLVTDGYDEPLNEAYKDKTSGLSGFMYASAHSTNAEQRDVKLQFNRYGSAQLLICFYESIPGWRVELLNLDDKTTLGDHAGTVTSLYSGEDYGKQGIQAVPAVKTEDTDNTTNLSNVSYAAGQYATDITGTSLDVDYSQTPAEASVTGEDYTKTGTNLMFKVPEADLSTADIAPANLDTKSITNITTNTVTDYNKLIQEEVTSGEQKYSYSPTVYYPVEQPDYVEGTTPGFTFHISFRMINEVTGEQINVHDASVFVPPYLTADDGTTKIPITYWRNNTRYTYIFRITQDVNGTTDPDTEIDPDAPTPDAGHALHAIVFEGVQVNSFANSTQTSESDVEGGNTIFFRHITNHSEGDGFSD